MLVALVLTASTPDVQSNGQEPRNRPVPGRTDESVSETAGNVYLPINLLKQKAVQKELKLSDAQVKKLPEFRLSIYKKNNLSSIPSGDLEVRRLAWREMSDSIDKELKGFLSADQYTRYQQIILQAIAADGWGLVTVFRNPAVAKELNLSKAQKELIDGIRKDNRASFGELIRGEREENEMRRAELRKSNNDKIERMLTDAQKAKWKKMIGAELKEKLHLRDR
jgi:hypothetical protein